MGSVRAQTHRAASRFQTVSTAFLIRQVDSLAGETSSSCTKRARRTVKRSRRYAGVSNSRMHRNETTGSAVEAFFMIFKTAITGTAFAVFLWIGGSAQANTISASDSSRIDALFQRNTHFAVGLSQIMTSMARSRGPSKESFCLMAV